MKKIFIFLLLIILVAGCSIVRIDTSDIDNIVNVVLSKENKLYNEEGIGYRYYIPRGVTHIETDEQTEKLYCNGDYYYLYVDTVSYYYKYNQIHQSKNDPFYYKDLNNDKGNGYLEINKINNLYYIDFYFNHAKFEAAVTKSKLNNTILNASYILSTVKFNSKIVKMMLDDDYFTNKTGKYNVFDSSTKSSKFELKIEEED